MMEETEDALKDLKFRITAKSTLEALSIVQVQLSSAVDLNYIDFQVKNHHILDLFF